ncbi:MAG TPA: hypothetical protein VJ550_02685 [Geomonas sp.]|nr:hypothetical protein [Geomonas sp.]
MNRLFWAVMVIALVTGCATQEQTARTQGTAAGVGIGAALGAGMGAIFGGGKGAAIGAAIGGSIGGVAGYSYSDKIADRHKELVGRENDLDARISYAQEVNQDTEQYNRQLESEVEAQRHRVYVLEEQVGRREASKEELRKQKHALSLKLKEARKNEETAQKQYEDLKKFRASHQRSKELDAEIAKLERNLIELKKNTNTLAALDRRI